MKLCATYWSKLTIQRKTMTSKVLLCTLLKPMWKSSFKIENMSCPARFNFYVVLQHVFYSSVVSTWVHVLCSEKGVSVLILNLMVLLEGLYQMRKLKVTTMAVCAKHRHSILDWISAFGISFLFPQMYIYNTEIWLGLNWVPSYRTFWKETMNRIHRHGSQTLNITHSVFDWKIFFSSPWLE